MAIRYRIKSAFTGFVEAYREVQEKLSEIRIQLDELKEDNHNNLLLLQHNTNLTDKQKVEIVDRITRNQNCIDELKKELYILGDIEHIVALTLTPGIVDSISRAAKVMVEKAEEMKARDDEEQELAYEQWNLLFSPKKKPITKEED